MKERTLKITLDKAREWYNRGGEYKELALSAFTEKELNKLPTSWEEYCDMYPIYIYEWYIDENSNCEQITFSSERSYTVDKNFLSTKEAAEAHLAYMQLHRLRDCYRQGWKPDWHNSLFYFCIILNNDKPDIIKNAYFSRFLSFPNKELAEQFLNNFRDLIEKAKDLI